MGCSGKVKLENVIVLDSWIDAINILLVSGSMLGSGYPTETRTALDYLEPSDQKERPEWKSIVSLIRCQTLAGACLVTAGALQAAG